MKLSDGAEERFWAKVDRGLTTECWEWQAAMTNEYGQFSIDRERWRGAHRMAWYFENDEWPESNRVLHTCDNKACVNPDHLYIGDAADNMRDAVERQHVNIGDNNG